MNGVQASIPKYRQNAQFLSAQGFVNPSAPPYSLNTVYHLLSLYAIFDCFLNKFIARLPNNRNTYYVHSKLYKQQ